MERREIDVGEVALSVIDEGEGAPVLLLHGFPDTADLWRNQAPVLVAAGYRVVAPDLRGYGRSAQPQEVEAYALPKVVADAVGLLDALGIERASVVGHDWGAVVAWALAGLHPGRVERLAVLSVGHPAAAHPRTIEQRQRSWYVLLFQFEGVAEELLRRDDWRLLREFLRGEGDVGRYVEDLARPGALTAALNWYRANTHPRLELEPRPPLPPAAAPTLGVWGAGDRFLMEDRMVRSGEQVTGPWRYERIEEAGHWIPLDAPAALNVLLLDHLKGATGDAG